MVWACVVGLPVVILTCPPKTGSRSLLVLGQVDRSPEYAFEPTGHNGILELPHNLWQRGCYTGGYNTNALRVSY